jgi:hypothetical protein
MAAANAHKGGYILAALLGAAAGGVIVAVITKALPRMAAQMTSGMMRNMTSKMKEFGFNPAET